MRLSWFFLGLYCGVMGGCLLKVPSPAYVRKLSKVELHNSVLPYLKKRYSWVNKSIFDLIFVNGSTLGWDNYLVVVPLIQAESRGKNYARGRPIFYSNSKEVHQARGLMQVMPFHLNGRYPSKYLHYYSYNLLEGIAVFSMYFKKEKRNINRTLKSYNSGPNSRYYNWPYIKKIKRNFSIILAEYNKIKYFNSYGDFVYTGSK